MKFFKGLISLAIAGMIIGCGGQVNSTPPLFGAETVKAAEILTSGSCGDEVTYVLTDDGTLTISGSGSMNTDSNNVPWENYALFLKNVVINNGVTSIGEDAFRGCSGLTSVEIPDSVTEIGWYAFGGCSGLTSVEIPKSVTTIGAWAFYDCSGLTSVEIPKSVTTIGWYAFRGCSGLTSVEIPNSVITIAGGTFYGCSGLTSVIIPDSLKTLIDCADIFHGTPWKMNNIPDSGGIGTILWTLKDGTITFSGNGELESDYSVIPGEYQNAKGYKVILNDGISSIGYMAFYDCSGLTSVEIPDSVTTIGWYAFSGCTGLTSVEIPNSVTEIGEDAFRGCSGLTSVSCPCRFKSYFNDKGDIRFTLSHGREEVDEAVAATCTTAGKTEGSHCSDCNAVIKKQETVSAKGHTEVKDNAVEATCTTAGKTEGSHCSDCNAVIKEQETVPATGKHTYSSWKTTKAATALATGKKEHKCTVCGKTETKTIAKLKPTIKLSKTKVTIKKGKSITIKVSKLAKGDVVKSWKTSNKKIATVKKGKIKAVKKGKATITVTLKSGKKATVKVTVK